ncbi:DNA helicase [Hortaea werneckii]|nr:DNA helicase [Hortaea werneckii]
MKATDISSFATNQLSLLNNELQAELAETQLLTSTHAPVVLQRAGLALLNLAVNSQRTGLGGKTLLELGIDPAVGGGELHEHGFRVGDICAVAEQPKGAEKKKERESKEKQGVEGVVTKVQKEAITVALDKEEVDIPGGKLWLVKLANDVTYKRLNLTMTKLQKMQPSEHSQLTQVLFGQTSPTPLAEEELKKEIPWNDPSLNDSQKEAIRFTLASREVSLIHGPPGTGKTHTLIELIQQLLARKQRILVCGPSNISVDNIVERLSSHKNIPMVRLGHPARLLPAVLNHSLEVLTKTSDAADIVRDIRAEMDAKQASIRKTRTGRERRGIYNEIRELRKEFRQREGRVVKELLRTSKVVLSTLHGAGSFHLKNEEFDVVVVDEASQALEAQCWIPIVMVGAVGKLVLAGDHLQLPPTIKSGNIKGEKSEGKGGKDSKKTAGKSNKGTEEARDELDKLSIAGDEPPTPGKPKDNKSPSSSSSSASSLETTLFDRLLTLHGPTIKRMLTTQYRMHETIMAFPSAALYDSQLQAADSVRARLLKDLPYPVTETDDTREPLVFWDTQGGDFPEKVEDEEGSGPDPSSSTAGGAGGGGGGGGPSSKKKASSLLSESKVNENEALLVSHHVRNLIQAGVKPEDIAVITPYNGQLALLSALLRERFRGIELGSVDGFQGREKEAVVWP